MHDWGFLLLGLLWLASGLILLVYPRQSQAASKRFEGGETLMPFPPLAGVPIWMVRIFGLVSISGSALFFYLLVTAHK